VRSTAPRRRVRRVVAGPVSSSTMRRRYPGARTGGLDVAAMSVRGRLVAVWLCRCGSRSCVALTGMVPAMVRGSPWGTGTQPTVTGCGPTSCRIRRRSSVPLSFQVGGRCDQRGEHDEQAGDDGHSHPHRLISHAPATPAAAMKAAMARTAPYSSGGAGARRRAVTGCARVRRRRMRHQPGRRCGCRRG
jgi:hypothetical protein